MKMVKKILLGLAATAAVLALVGCKTNDDTQNAIGGKNNNYDIDWTNEGTDAYRAYKSTSLKHAGALVRVTFKAPEAGNYSKMGVIFDLHDNAADKEAKDFYIIGLAGTNDYNLYASYFTNVTDLQAENFGTKLATNPAVETVLFDETSSNDIGTVTPPEKDANGSITYYVYYKAFANNGTAEGESDATKGYYEWAVFDFTAEQATAAKALMKNDATNYAALAAVGGRLVKGQKILDAFTLGTNNAVPQNQIAVYAKVDAKKRLSGEWEFLDMYKEAEEIEE
jgi:hypothetical protein